MFTITKKNWWLEKQDIKDRIVTRLEAPHQPDSVQMKLRIGKIQDHKVEITKCSAK